MSFPGSRLRAGILIALGLLVCLVMPLAAQGSVEAAAPDPAATSAPAPSAAPAPASAPDAVVPAPLPATPGPAPASAPATPGPSTTPLLPGAMGPADIAAALQAQKLEYQELDPSSWRLVFAGQHFNPVLGIKYTPQFVYIVIPLFGVPKEAPLQFYQGMLQLNFGLSQLKLMLDPGNQLVASYEIPTNLLTPAELVADVKGLAADADDMYPKLRVMAGLPAEEAAPTTAGQAQTPPVTGSTQPAPSQPSPAPAATQPPAEQPEHTTGQP